MIQTTMRPLIVPYAPYVTDRNAAEREVAEVNEVLRQLEHADRIA